MADLPVGWQADLLHIQSRFSWGKVDLDNPDPKKQKKYKDQEGIVDFMKWYFNKEK